MQPSLFIELVVKFFAAYVARLTEFINGEEGTQRYLFNEMLDKQFLAGMKWTNININGRAVMADVVTLDSNFPLKQRGRVATAEGEITKLATKRYLNETQMSEIIQLQDSRINRETEIVTLLFQDTKAVTVGIWERLEYFFLQGLSSGFFAVEKENNVGVEEVRVDLKLPDDQRYGAVTKWSEADAKPIDDIERIIAAAAAKNKPAPMVIMMDEKTWYKFRNNQQVRENIAGYLRYPISQNLPTPQIEVINEFLTSSYGLKIRVVKRRVTLEKNGKDTLLECWTENSVVFLPSETSVGKLYYGTLAAEVFVDNSREQQKVDDYILIQKYSEKGDTPLEVTSSQALVIPIPDMFNVFIMDVEEAEPTGDDSQTEGDTTITLYGETDVLRSNVINALRNLGVTVNDNALDKTIVKKVNELSAEKEEQLKFALEIPIVDAGTNKSVTTTSTTLDGTVTAATGKTIASTLWTKVSGPAGGTIANAALVDTTVSALQDGVYVYKLTATDSTGTVSSDQITITVDVP